MNKLVIVGNGFDLAHRLPTSYKHFIDDFWKNLKNTYQEDKIKEVIFVSDSSYKFLDGSILNYDSFQKSLKEYSLECGYHYDQNNNDCYTNNSRFHAIFKFENNFFKELNLKTSIENWVDIENEYYQELKRISKRRDSHYSGNQQEFEKEQLLKNKKSVEKLNQEFQQIKELFESYMCSHVKTLIDTMDSPKLSDGFFDFFDMTFVTQDNVKEKIRFRNYLSEFSKKDRSTILKYQEDFVLYQTDIGGGKRALDSYSTLIYQTIFLNFNYTKTASAYSKVLNELFYCESKEIKIHGELNNNENEINFGFGDEMDDDYKSIENLNDNEFLKNFKSFKYSQNSNYKNLLDYIELEKFQVYIMGHSCGLSDRTLLNTIFEHENCRSIKVFYHKRKDGYDNFTEIIQNISRHFNDKKMMRSKIVNKSLCVPLPQDIRFQENN